MYFFSLAYKYCLFSFLYLHIHPMSFHSQFQHIGKTPPPSIRPHCQNSWVLYKKLDIITFSKANLSSKLSSRKLAEGGWIDFFVWDTVLANKSKFIEYHFYRNRFLFVTLWDHFPQQPSLRWEGADPQHCLSRLFLQVSGAGDCSIAGKGAEWQLRLSSIAMLLQYFTRIPDVLVLCED